MKECSKKSMLCLKIVAIFLSISMIFILSIGTLWHECSGELCTVCLLVKTLFGFLIASQALSLFCRVFKCDERIQLPEYPKSKSDPVNNKDKMTA